MSAAKQKLGLAALAAAVMVASSAGAFAAGDAHEHGHGGATLVLNHGKKWNTDEAARKGMDGIRVAFTADLKAIHAGKQTPEQYAALGKKVLDGVSYMVANCKLDPQADAQLHIVLADLIAGAEAMEGKDKSANARNGAERVAKALNAYGRYFDHPGWKRV